MAMDSSPFKEIERILERMGRGTDLPVEMQRSMAIDVADHGDRYEVTVDLPGFSKEDIDLRLTDRTLHVDAVRETELEERAKDEEEEEVPGGTVRTGEEEPGITYIRKERRRESVNRSVELPDPVDDESVEATLANGVLTVTLRKLSPEEDARHIDID
ncbi:hypothetical protein BRC81_14055 [Halobacteriales archaeon QS_1_68_20]|nr:MAG: hypothetical protein BRC81_14055 [Halobacteriales archaeon QS_1_68_20]